jgi:hypothetical protein
MYRTNFDFLWLIHIQPSQQSSNSGVADFVVFRARSPKFASEPDYCWPFVSFFIRLVSEEKYCFTGCNMLKLFVIMLVW